jgi:hypothetical protein
VLPIPSPNAITGNTLVCVSDTNQLYLIQEHPGNTYQWIVTGGTVVSGLAMTAWFVNWDTVSTGTIRMIETGSNGCPGDTNTLNVTISRQPVVSASRIPFHLPQPCRTGKRHGEHGNHTMDHIRHRHV